MSLSERLQVSLAVEIDTRRPFVVSYDRQATNSQLLSSLGGWFGQSLTDRSMLLRRTGAVLDPAATIESLELRDGDVLTVTLLGLVVGRSSWRADREQAASSTAEEGR